MLRNHSECVIRSYYLQIIGKNLRGKNTKKKRCEVLYSVDKLALICNNGGFLTSYNISLKFPRQSFSFWYDDGQTKEQSFKIYL